MIWEFGSPFPLSQLSLPIKRSWRHSSKRTEKKASGNPLIFREERTKDSSKMWASKITRHQKRITSKEIYFIIQSFSYQWHVQWNWVIELTACEAMVFWEFCPFVNEFNIWKEDLLDGHEQKLQFIENTNHAIYLLGDFWRTASWRIATIY